MYRLLSRQGVRDLFLGLALLCAVLSLMLWPQEAMEAAGLVSRKVYAEVPPRVEYTLTETGYSLKPILDSMVAWGDGYKKKIN